MRVLPWLTEEFYSPLPPVELLQRLRANVRQPAIWRNSVEGQSCSFRGQMGSNSFTISRIPQGRDSMQPVIEGRVSANMAKGSRLRLRYRLSWPTLIFTVFWLSATGAWVVAELGQASIDSGLWGALTLFCAGSLLFTILFWNEVTEARQLLTYLLKLEPKPVQLQR